MKMELVERQIREWGEVMITTASGQVFELHIGDTRFDFQERLIWLKTTDGGYAIDGDSVDVVRWHLGHPMD